jgi:type II secretory pathway pseudopilin PulG
VSEQQDGAALYRGQKGDKGARGERGEAGASRLPARVAWALVVLFAVAVAVGGTAYFSAVTARRAAAHAIQVSQAEQRKQETAQQAQGLAIERKLCLTFGELAANQPPPGNPVKNPSRAYDQRNHAILAQIGPDLDCTAIRKAGSR